jgi:hypothetical protein
MDGVLIDSEPLHERAKGRRSTKRGIVVSDLLLAKSAGSSNSASRSAWQPAFRSLSAGSWRGPHCWIVRGTEALLTERETKRVGTRLTGSQRERRFPRIRRVNSELVVLALRKGDRETALKER